MKYVSFRYIFKQIVAATFTHDSVKPDAILIAVKENTIRKLV